MKRAIGLAMLLLAAAAFAQSPLLVPERVIDEGGTRVAANLGSGGQYVQHGSFHQTTIGKVASDDGSYVAWIGYWHPRIVYRDVAVVQILAPVNVADTMLPVTPSASIANYGDVGESFKAWFIIRRTNGTQLYWDTTRVTLDAHTQFTVPFRQFRMTVTGPCVTCCSTAMATDMSHANDFKVGTFKCLGRPQWPEGWIEVQPIPRGPSQRAVREGGWLAFMAGNTRFYGAKGGGVGDFASYDPLVDQWETLPRIPLGSEMKMPKRGARGATDGNGAVYCTKGNNTLGFWRYTTADHVWHQMDNVPFGPMNRKVKCGTDIVYVDKAGTGYLYLLKGYLNEFYRFNIPRDTWEALPSVPGSSYQWKEGSWLASDGATALYAHKASKHEFYKYDLLNDTWIKHPLTGMPFQNHLMRNKKSKDGGCADYWEGSIYAFKGGNTQEFWQYIVARDSWAELETIPSFGTTMARRRIRDGADIATFGQGVFYALKGAKTCELWRYTMPTGLVSPRPDQGGVAAVATTALGDGRVVIAPNPLAAGFATVRCNLPDGQVAEVSVYDALGRAVLRSTAVVRHAAFVLDLRSLASGVYLARINADGRSTAQKLVVRR